MDSRHDGKRFPGCLKENARPSPVFDVGLFLLSRRMNPCSHPLPVLLIIGLCLAGLLAFTFSPAVGMPIIETEFETEIEDDWLLQSPLSVALSGWINQKLAASRREFSPALIIPPSPPPEHA
jgi:hypothetical protein